MYLSLQASTTYIESNNITIYMLLYFFNSPAQVYAKIEMTRIYKHSAIAINKYRAIAKVGNKEQIS